MEVARYADKDKYELIGNDEYGYYSLMQGLIFESGQFRTGSVGDIQ